MAYTSYGTERQEYFDSTTYLPQIGSTHYDFYHVSTEPGEPLIPYGWRPDWSRPAPAAWPASGFASNSQMPHTASQDAEHKPLPFRNHSSNVALSQPHIGYRFFLSGEHCTLLSQGTVAKPTRSTLRAIKREMHRPFPCTLCGKSFSQAANLTAHKRVHTGEKPFACHICNRPFSQSSSLVTHKRTHTGERPYPCPHCEKAFTDSSTLTKHLRTHTGMKPYGCSMCSMRFTQSGNLHRHMKTHRAS